MFKISRLTKRDVVVSSLAAVIVAITTTIGQYVIAGYQMDRQISSAKEIQYSEKLREAEKRKRELVREIREVHELLIHSDMKFSIASEVDFMFKVFEHEMIGLDEGAKLKFSVLKEEILKTLGIDSREKSFSSSSEEFIERQSKFIGLVAEAENYFSRDVKIAAAAYLKFYKSSDYPFSVREGEWRGLAKGLITDIQDDGAYDQSKHMSVMMKLVMKFSQRQQVVVDLYNALYAAMDREISELQCVGFEAPSFSSSQ